jgi:hypothetical protein
MAYPHVAEWLYRHFGAKSWKRVETSGDAYRLTDMDLLHETYPEIVYWQDFETEWFEDDFANHSAETALYAAAVLWLAEHHTGHEGVADARRDLSARD